MKNSMRVFSSLLLAAGLFCGGAITASAKNQEGKTQMVLPGGNSASIQFSNGADSFFNFSGVVPGDTLTQEIEVKNNRSETVTFYLNAAAPTQNEALLREISLTITNTATNRVIYSGNLTGNPTSAYGDDLYKNSTTRLNGINLGSFSANSTLYLKAVISVPLTVDNTYADNISKVTWQVRAQMSDPYYPGGTTRPSTPRGTPSYPDTDTDRSSPGNLATINDNDVPLAGNLFTIPDGQVPLADLPKTGGALRFGSMLALLAGTATALIGKRIV